MRTNVGSIMTTWLPRFFVLLLLVLPFVPVVAVEPDDTEIARLVRQLGSDDFDQREAATTRLKAIGEPALDAVTKAATSSDPEVRHRAEDIILTIEGKLFGEFCLIGHTAGVWGVAVSHRRAVVSQLPDSTRLPSGERAAVVTSCV